MEYQSFFILLKKFECNGECFLCPNPLEAHGFVQIKKEFSSYSVVIQLNNYVNPCCAFIVNGKMIAKVKIESATTKAIIDFEVSNDAVVLVFDYNFFASKNGTNKCMQAYNIVQDYLKENKDNKTTLQKIFGTVHDTYFYDCIKPKLASVFAMGKPIDGLAKLIDFSKWVSLKAGAIEKVFGIIYKDNFVYLIAMGSSGSEYNDMPHKTYSIEQKTYNILFLSASTGKIIDF